MSASTIPSFSIRAKLLLFSTALVLIPGGIYGAITVSSSRAAIALVVGRQLVTEARNAADRLSTELRSERRRFESFAVQDVMREIRIGDLDKRISSFLASAKLGCPACLELAVLDDTNRVVASSNPAWIGETERDEGREHPGPTIEGPLRLEGGKASVLRFSVPVPDPEAAGSKLGLLVAHLDWERGSNAIARVRKNLLSVDLDADVWIVDGSGTIIGGAARSDAPWRVASIIELPGPADRETATARIAPKVGMLFGAADLPGDLPEWQIVVAQPLDEALAPVRRIAALLASALAVTLLAAGALAFAAGRRVTRPLGDLTAAAEEVGRGARPARIVPEQTRDEVGVLTAAFNRMSVDLQRAEHDLVEASKFAYVGELAAGVAHEVRTPLGVLRSSAQLLEPSVPENDAEARELLQMLRDEVDRIERIVSSLLELGRPHALELETVSLGPIVFRAADFVAVQARERGIALRRNSAGGDAKVRCDPDLIYQVALNLLVNAVQIVPNGKAIEVRLLGSSNGYAAFEVRDEGPGMTRDVRERIFEPFFTHREGGTGLGLTFVQRVVREHGGRVTVESAANEGTTFRVELPLAEQDE